MFKLVGDEYFTVGKQKAKCELRVDPQPHFSFSYSLFVDGKPLEKFTEKQMQSMRSWAVVTHGQRFRVCLGNEIKAKIANDLTRYFFSKADAGHLGKRPNGGS